MQSVKDFFCEKESEMIRVLRRLISFESVAVPSAGSHPQGEVVAACLDAALEEARSLGLSARNLDGHAGIIELSGADGEYPLGVLCHLDVVPAGAGWTVPPLAGEIRNGKLFGRGTTDNKGPFVSALFALAFLQQQGVQLPHGVRLIAGTCEENGSADMDHCKEMGVIPDMVFSPDASFPVVNTEKGILRFRLSAKLVSPSALQRLSGGSVINMVARDACAVFAQENEILCEKALSQTCGNVRFFRENGALCARGEAAHASRPQDGENALTALVAALCRVLPETDSFFPALCALNALAPHNETDGRAFGIACSEPISGELTLNLGLCSLENGVFTADFDVRFPLCTSAGEIRQNIQNAVQNTPFEATFSRINPPHHVPPEHPLIRALLRAYEECTGEVGKCVSMGGATYVHDIEGGVAFGIEKEEGEDHRIHSPDEFIFVSELCENAELFVSAIQHLQKEVQ